MGRIVGIDLGTTNTAVAVLQDGRPRVIEDDRGYKVLPSVVSARGEGRFIVGQAAHNLILTHPDRTVYATKRLIGRRFDSPEVQRCRERLQYEIKEGPDGGVLVQIGDEWMSPAEVAAVVLQVAKSITEKAIGEVVDEAVVTVPAHFNHLQRQETIEAARMAGFKCDRLLNEPTAAALAYGHRKSVERTLVVFDLGGGTFDVTVLRLSAGVYEVLATSGDTWLGGEDFDYRIVDHLADAFQTRTGSDLRTDRNALQRVKDAAERAKCDLSFSDRANVVIPHVLAGQNLEAVLTRSDLESLTGDLVQRCLDVTRAAVADAGLPLSEVDDVLLVGGQTRMPRVREAVSGLFGREPSRAVHPEEAVAVGAAVHGAALADPDEPQVVLLDVTPFDLGIDAAGGMFSMIVARNAQVPTSETRTFATVHDNQTSVRITVRQGESRAAAENEFLGEFVMEGLAPAPRMQTKIDVTFKLDANGILNVAAVNKQTGERQVITVRNYAERAKDPRMPTADEAERDEAARTSRSAAPPPVVKATPGAKKKAGFLSSLFGSDTSGGRKPSAPVRAVKPAAPTPAPVAAAVPVIDMSAVAEVTPEDEVIPDAAFATAAEEEDLYGRSAATLGMGGTPLPDPRGIAEASVEAELDAGELFGGLEEDDADPATDEPKRIPPPAMLEELGQESVSEGLFGEAVLTDDAGLGEEDAAPPRDGDDATFAEAGGGEVDVDLGTAPPMLSASFAEPEPALAAGRSAGNPASYGFVDAANDPFATGADGAATAIPVDVFTDQAMPEFTPHAPPRSPFDESLTASGVVPPAPAAGSGGLDEPAASPSPAPAEGGKPRRKPARLRLQYREQESFVVEYRDNLRRNGAFIKTDKPLAIGRECLFEIDAPGLVEPLVFDAVVTYHSDGRGAEPPGMGVEYRMDDVTRARISTLVSR
ncbi:MAG: hypothetical protein EXR71_20255 [Myxococcales bacterium]|nr:hypothetical protein [Myxococcales bacterium]